MNLTPLDVRRKKFDKGFRGYDPTEVDLFLKQLADRMEELLDDTRRAEERVQEAENKLVHYEKVELALQEALESARETARRSEASAEEKARLIVKEAELRAEEILHEAERERHGMRQDVVRLNARQAEVAARLRGFLMSELEVLAQFQGDEPFGFIKLEPAERPALPTPPQQLAAPAEPIVPPHAPAGETASEEPADLNERSPLPEPDSADASPPGPDPEPDPAATLDPPKPAADLPHEPTPPPVFAPVDEPTAGEWADMPDEPAPPSVPAFEPFSAPQPPTPPEEPPVAPATLSGAYAPSEEMPPPRPDASTVPPAEDSAPESPPAVTGGWDLRSLVTGEERSVSASDEERARIRRILDDLD